MNNNNYHINEETYAKIASSVFAVVIFALFLNLLLIPFPTLAKIKDYGSDIFNIWGVISEKQDTVYEESFTETEYKVKWTQYTAVTAYNSLKGQTDDSPCITANNFNLCKHGIEDSVAANFLRFGTKIRIPEVFGDRIFYVRDRMNSRYTNRVDVWLLSYSDARKFGKKYLKIEILE